MRYWVVEDEEEEEIRYSNIVQEEEFEDEDPPEGFAGLQTGSNLVEEETEYTGPKPWDPSESFFTYL